MRRTPTALSLLAVLALAGCGSGSAGPSSTPGAGRAGSGSGLHVGSTSLGRVLVDGAGRTVYLLTADTRGRSTCDASCLTYWPAVAPPAGTALPGVTAAVGHTSTPGGAAIATVGGRPLYTYVQDKVAGDVTGEGVRSFGGTWYAVSPGGQPVKPSSGSAGLGSGY